MKINVTTIFPEGISIYVKVIVLIFMLHISDYVVIPEYAVEAILLYAFIPQKS